MARPVAGPRAEKAGLPQWIRPQLTELVDAAPEGFSWLHEIKFDGYRMHARLDRGVVRLLTRTGLDWKHKYPAIAVAVASLGDRQAYLDTRAVWRGPRWHHVVQYHPDGIRQRQCPPRSSSSCSIFYTSTAKICANGR